MILKTIDVKNDYDFATKCYFYIDEKSNCGFLIDPGAEADKLLQTINQNQWHIEKILLTHGHFDHIGAVKKLHDELQIPYYILHNGLEYLSNPELNLSAFFGDKIILTEPVLLNENDKITLNGNKNCELQVIATPGHTPDSVIYYDNKNHLAFVGDTIFRNGIGATHFPGGDALLLQQSIFQKIFTLPENTSLYSGHSSPTDVQTEANRYKHGF